MNGVGPLWGRKRVVREPPLREMDLQLTRVVARKRPVRNRPVRGMGGGGGG